jgi:hypothetical protein
MLSREKILKSCGHEKARSFAIDIYQRITNKEEQKASIFATAFLDPDLAKKVYKCITQQVEETQPQAEDIVLLPPLDFVCVEDGIVRIDEILLLVLSKTYGVIVPVVITQPSGTELLDVLIDLYSMRGIEDTYITMNNISETVLQILSK